MTEVTEQFTGVGKTAIFVAMMRQQTNVGRLPASWLASGTLASP